MSKRPRQSRTIRFNVFMAVVASIHGSIALLQPVLTPMQFVVVSMLIGAIHAGGGIYLRTITTEPIK